MRGVMAEILGHGTYRWFYGHSGWQSMPVRLLAFAALVFLGCMDPSYGAEKNSAKADREPETSVTRTEVHMMEEEILRLTNIERRRESLKPLQHSVALHGLAVRHSKDMCQTKTLEHESEVFPKGRQRFPERLASIGVRNGGENIAYRTLTKKPKVWAQEVVSGWLKSPRHKKNMLNPKFRFLGVGVMPCRNDLGYATQVFSTEPGRASNAHNH
ncbi:MAG: CAP domain-containing protein [Desulfomonile tiedjei]|nr:CAP domain-containing protein [Desulfomonile tiedjei]